MDFWKSQDGTKRMEILCIFFDIKMVDVGGRVCLVDEWGRDIN